jgi:hypothetical protein
MDGTRYGFRPRILPLIACVGLALVIGPALLPAPALGAKLHIANRYSPLNASRSVRARTDYIVLHTTEGGDRSSLARIRRGGLAHYVVMSDGRVYRVVSKRRIARHAGRSLWDGCYNIDRVSLGIEVVGYHNRSITDAQIAALRELLRQLQSLYDIPDDHVLTHSMVAYGKRNRWHHLDHRGRKRCGMLFARPQLRRQLGLEARPTADPDVAKGRLAVADPYLATVLFGPEDEADRVAEARFEGPAASIITSQRTAWFIARDAYDAASTVYVFPNGRRRRGDQIRDWSRLPRGTRVLLDQTPAYSASWLELGRDGDTASELAGTAYAAATTIYVLPGNRVRRGNELSERDFRRLPPGTRVFVGFEYAGRVTRGRTAFELCGPSYSRHTTLYLLPGGRVRTGAEIRENSIPGGTMILIPV